MKDLCTLKIIYFFKISGCKKIILATIFLKVSQLNLFI